MSNRGRQVVASFLIKDMGLDWRLGAEYFEEMLIDYDAPSNYGNWNYIAGVGVDPRMNRYFHVSKQATTYDPDAHYIRFWLPQLKHVPTYLLHNPCEFNPALREKYNISEALYPITIVIIPPLSSKGNKDKGNSKTRIDSNTLRDLSEFGQTITMHMADHGGIPLPSNVASDLTSQMNIINNNNINNNNVNNNNSSRSSSSSTLVSTGMDVEGSNSVNMEETVTMQMQMKTNGEKKNNKRRLKGNKRVQNDYM
jgi:hypothetical protein